MRKGDISNELPKRVLVVDDTFLEKEVKVSKKFKVIPVAKVDKKIKRELLSFLYLFTVKQGITLELVSFDQESDELEAFLLALDKVGTNPFRYSTSYPSITQLVEELPYRPEVIAVVDIPSRLLRYGHWGRTLTDL